MCAVLSVLVIIVAAGAAGGLANFLRKQDGTSGATDAPSRPLDLLRFIAMGIIAAFTLPLFLSLAKSRLMTEILSRTDAEPRYEEMLILAGFCIIAAFSAVPFLDRLSLQLLQERTDRIEKETKRAAQERESENRLEAAIEQVDEKRAPPPSAASPAEDLPSDRLLGEAQFIRVTPEQHAALKALTAKAYRTRTGIADEIGVSKTRISELLESLIEAKLAEPTTSPNTGGKRFKITDLGRAVLGSGSPTS